MGPALCLLGLLFVKCDWWATVALMSLAVTAVGAIYSGHYVNPIDLAPNFAGTMSGIVNTVGNVPGFLAPLAAGYITDKQVRKKRNERMKDFGERRISRELYSVWCPH